MNSVLLRVSQMEPSGHGGRGLGHASAWEESALWTLTVLTEASRTSARNLRYSWDPST